MHNAPSRNSLRRENRQRSVFDILRQDVRAAARILVPHDRDALIAEVSRVTQMFKSRRTLANRKHVLRTAQHLVQTAVDPELTVAALAGVLYGQRSRRRSKVLRQFVVSETERSAGRAYGVYELLYLKHWGGRSIEGAEMAMLLCGAHSPLLMQMLRKEFDARGNSRRETGLEAAYGVSATLVIAAQAARLENGERGQLFRMMLPEWHGDIAALVSTVCALSDSGSASPCSAPFKK